jgi:RNA polymerase sigma factor (sigma-70 family)
MATTTLPTHALRARSGRETKKAEAPHPAASRSELEELFVSCLPQIERAVACVLRGHHLRAAERDEFQAEVSLAFIQHDYRILARFQGRCSLRTYLVVVVERLFIDYRRRFWGNWRPSKTAKRLGSHALELEVLIHRDGRPVAEAVDLVRAGCGNAATREELTALAERLARRGARSAVVSEIPSDVSAGDLASPEVALDGATTAARTQEVVTRVMGTLSDEDRLIVRLRFEDGASVVAIARALQTEQKPLYRRIERLLVVFRAALAAEGIGWADLRVLIERGQCHLRL